VKPETAPAVADDPMAWPDLMLAFVGLGLLVLSSWLDRWEHARS
jgi:hypothetical protein